MKKVLLMAFVCCLPLFAFSQTVEKEHYIYNVVKLTGNLERTRFKVKLDNGKNFKKLKDEDGKIIKFRTPAALLTYLASEGWELYVSGDNILGNHYEHKRGHKSESSWIIRRACTKEELDEFLRAGVNRKSPQYVTLVTETKPEVLETEVETVETTEDAAVEATETDVTETTEATKNAVTETVEASEEVAE